MGLKIDKIDRQILELIQENGRIKQSELAHKVKLSEPSLGERLKHLEEKKIIEKYFAKVNPKKLGKDIAAFIEVKVDSSKHYVNFIQSCYLNPEILECHAVTGNGSHILKIRTENTAFLEKLLSTIQKWKGVTSTRTSLVLSTHKETMKISTL